MSKVPKRRRSGPSASSSSSIFKWKDGSYLWFTNSEDYQRFVGDFEMRRILNPRYVDYSYLTKPENQDLLNLLDGVQLVGFVTMNMEQFNPDLVQAFYCNLKKKDNGVRYTTVNGREIIVDETMINSIIGAPMWNDERARQYDDAALMRELYGDNIPIIKAGRPTIHGMKRHYRFILYLISRVIKPRDGNHTTLSRDDKYILNAIISGTSLNYCRMILHHMDRVLEKHPYLPYPFLVTRLMERNAIRVDIEAFQTRKKNWEITYDTFRREGLMNPPPAPRQRRENPRNQAPNEDHSSLCNQIASLTTTVNRIDERMESTQRSVESLAREVHDYFAYVRYSQNENVQVNVEMEGARENEEEDDEETESGSEDDEDDESDE